jgi:hypothetical protein
MFSNQNSPDSSYYMPPFAGGVYLFAIYGFALTQSEITTNYLARIPNSLPTVWSKLVTVNEDGERTAGSHWITDPGFYSLPVPVQELVQISFSGLL